MFMYQSFFMIEDAAEKHIGNVVGFAAMLGHTF
jgi:hypothetical protein